jgi:uncharacterized protein (DUF2147 family)
MTRVFLYTLLLLSTALQCFAVDKTPEGLWKTFDDEGQPSGQVLIEEKAGVFTGKVVGIFNPVEREERCQLCTDERKNQPVLGMIILKGLLRVGDNEWADGSILDPKNGKAYRVKVELSDHGTRLHVRGFIGISLLGRSQTWQRELNPAAQK